ncbi:MAG: thioredoxin fold domain-containing protein [Aquificae bacterium]|nr:thioredoxin fold domain-containing protein [Aquificota bacterium]
MVATVFLISFSFAEGESCLSTTDVSVEEAQQRLSSVLGQAKVVSVSEAPIEGFYEIIVELRGRKIPIYVDCDFNYLITGEIIDIKKRESLTRKKILELSKEAVEDKIKKLEKIIGKEKAQKLKEKVGTAFLEKAKIVDITGMPKENLVLGNPNAKIKIYIIEDPECPACAIYHESIEEVLKDRKDIAFGIILFPLPFHKHAKGVSYNIICQKDMNKKQEILKKSFEHVKNKKSEALKDLQRKASGDCKKAEEIINTNMEFFGKKVPIGGTPTTVFPLKNGKGIMISGVLDKETIEEIVDILYK